MCICTLEVQGRMRQPLIGICTNLYYKKGTEAG